MHQTYYRYYLDENEIEQYNANLLPVNFINVTLINARINSNYIIHTENFTIVTSSLAELQEADSLHGICIVQLAAEERERERERETQNALHLMTLIGDDATTHTASSKHNRYYIIPCRLPSYQDLMFLPQLSAVLWAGFNEILQVNNFLYADF